jgi:hypothetical protein
VIKRLKKIILTIRQVRPAKAKPKVRERAKVRRRHKKKIKNKVL